MTVSGRWQTPSKCERPAAATALHAHANRTTEHMNIIEKLRLMQTDHIPELGEAIAEIEHLRREAHAWSKACEDATTKLYKLSTHHPRLEVRYWTGEYWEPLYGARFHEVLNALDLTPN